MGIEEDITKRLFEAEATEDQSDREHEDKARELESRMSEVEQFSRSAYEAKERWSRAQMEAAGREAEAACALALSVAQEERDGSLHTLWEEREQIEQETARSQLVDQDEARDRLERDAAALIETWEKERRQKRAAWTRQVRMRLKKALALREQITRTAQEQWVGAGAAWVEERATLEQEQERRIKASMHAGAEARGQGSNRLWQRLGEIGAEAGRESVALWDWEQEAKAAALAELMATVAALSPRSDDPLAMLREDETIRATAVERWGEQLAEIEREAQGRAASILGRAREQAMGATSEAKEAIAAIGRQEAEAMGQIEAEIAERLALARERLQESLARISLERDLSIEEMAQGEPRETAALAEIMAGDPPPGEALAALFERYREETAQREEARQDSRTGHLLSLEDRQGVIEEGYHAAIQQAQDRLEQAKTEALTRYRQGERAAWAEYEAAILAAREEVEQLGEEDSPGA